MNRKLILLLFFLLISLGFTQIYAQKGNSKRIVTGTVSDEGGPLAGASVLI